MGIFRPLNSSLWLDVIRESFFWFSYYLLFYQGIYCLPRGNNRGIIVRRDDREIVSEEERVVIVEIIVQAIVGMVVQVIVGMVVQAIVAGERWMAATGVERWVMATRVGRLATARVGRRVVIVGMEPWVMTTGVNS